MTTEFLANTSLIMALLDFFALHVYMHKYVVIQVIFTIPGTYSVFTGPQIHTELLLYGVY